MNFKQLAQALATAATLLIAQPIHAETFYFHNDHLGTPQALTDDSGTVVWQGNYSPFGEVNETTDTVEQNIRFPGQYFEEETGLHYNYFRDYDPATGRYIEGDPIGLNGGLGLFNYVEANPISMTDTWGLAVDCKWVTDSYYTKTTEIVIQEEMGYWQKVCFPSPYPTIFIPDPGGKKGSSFFRFSTPFDISFKKECVRDWIKTQSKKVEYQKERWMRGYLECTDDCSGEIDRHWSPDRLAGDFPDV